MKKDKMESPMRTIVPGPEAKGDLGVNLDFGSSPTDRISGHNISPLPGGEGSFGGGNDQRAKMNSPAKVIKRIKVGPPMSSHEQE